jgi:hypothetical protein
MTAKATAMIVAFKKPLSWVKKKGRKMPTTSSSPARARAHHDGIRPAMAARHS